MIRYFRAGVLLALCAHVVVTHGGAMQVIVRVISQLNQYAPAAGLTEGSPGIFYFPSRGAVFSMTTQGALTKLGSLANATAPLVGASNGLLYSAVGILVSPPYPNPGNVFSVGAAPGTLTTYSTQIGTPTLLETLPDGSLFGSEFDAVTYTSSLVISDLNGNVTPIYQFPRFDVIGDALFATDGNYYAVVVNNDVGYVARITPSGSLTRLHSLGNAFYPGYPVTLIQASDGNLYGTTPTAGTVYKLTLDGQYTLLYGFRSGGSANHYPRALIEGSDGNLYGSTDGYLSPSLIYRLTKSGQYTQLYEFAQNQGCPCLLTQGSDGIIYGTAQSFIFELFAGLPRPRPQALQFNPVSGAVGTRVLLWGRNLLSGSVAFNGVSAGDVTGSGPNYIWATVPAGAATGPITVTTPGGSSTTRASFTVQ